MKRATLTVLGLFCVVTLCMAQIRYTGIQRETAVQQIRADGLSAGHSSLPVGSKVKITNPANGLEIEATIVSQLPESHSKVIDLSYSAAQALGIGPGGPVIVTTLSIPPSPPFSPGPKPAVIPEETGSSTSPYNIVINNYLSNADQPPGDGQNVLPPGAVLEKTPLFTSPPVANIQIIPGLPDPRSNKIYRLLVGTYPGVDGAFQIYRQLQAAGFEVSQEQAGEMCRVYAAGIPASKVYYAAQRLGAIGFHQVWVQE
jgi:hypothetical protein